MIKKRGEERAAGGWKGNDEKIGKARREREKKEFGVVVVGARRTSWGVPT